MILNDETGLPEVPEGYYWEVVETNWPIPNTLCVELRVETEVTKIKTVVDELPKKWWQTYVRHEKRRVEYTAMGSEMVDSESLVDTTIYYPDKKDSKPPTGDGWVQEVSFVTTVNFGQYLYPSNYSYTAVPSERSFKFSRPHPVTPDSIRTAAEKIYKRWEKEQGHKAARLREKEERANLTGKYPPKTLKG